MMKKVHFMGSAYIGNTACGRYVDTFGTGSAFREGRMPEWTSERSEVTCERCIRARDDPTRSAPVRKCAVCGRVGTRGFERIIGTDWRCVAKNAYARRWALTH
jgi:hypothetical protein